MTTPGPSGLKFLGAGWFAVVMGLGGLALAWVRAAALLGELAGAVAAVLAGLAALVLVLLVAAYLWRWQRYPLAVADDFSHPVRHPFVGAISLSVLLVATLAATFLGPEPWVRALWMLGAASQFGVTVWLLGRWIQPGLGLGWPGVTPLLLIPLVGNVLTPLAGLALGLPEWTAAQFGLGLLLWPVVLVLLAVRLAVAGMWPQRMLPTSFITIVAPALIGLAALQWGVPVAWGWMAWGIGLFFLLWSAQSARQAFDQPFALPFWSVSFPLAAFTSLTLRLAQTSGALMQGLGLILLALTTLVIASLVLATLKGLRSGSLLAPETVAIVSAPT